MVELPTLGLSPEERFILVGLWIERKERFGSVVGLVNGKLREFVPMNWSRVPLWHDLLLSKLTLVGLIVLLFGPDLFVGFLNKQYLYYRVISYKEIFFIPLDDSLALFSQEVAKVLTELITVLRSEPESRALALGNCLVVCPRDQVHTGLKNSHLGILTISVLVRQHP